MLHFLEFYWLDFIEHHVSKFFEIDAVVVIQVVLADNLFDVHVAQGLPQFSERNSNCLVRDHAIIVDVELIEKGLNFIFGQKLCQIDRCS